ncbi:hypothetical protein [Pelagerythrobacter marinus]|uniref:hypothetical protein n=1 Tax=Pelagerythrobacter marinus TaxID=538382 RepID=UPI002AC9E317|nr:hypothetical protein [Pelagerythrobacter marinus]WPZ06577.1 hypothetical protein T8T98_14365 [Pelagerythrobacter marinus]
MSSASLVWKGKALTDRMRRAQKVGVNATMSQCVKHAKSNHTWQNRTGVLEGSLGIAEYAREDAQGVVGHWGSQDVRHALIHELGGTIKHPGGTAYYIGEDGLAVFVSGSDPRAAELPKTKPHDIIIPARPYLRPAADEYYPSLVDNIRAAFTKDKGGARA